MGIPFRITRTFAKISLLFLAMVINSCNTLKRVGENELLLKKNAIYADGKAVKDENIESLVFQEPNSTILGYPLRLNLYYLAKKNPDSSFQAWLYRKEKREQRLIDFLSKKQVDRLGESFLVSGLSEWLKKIGESPVIIDTVKTKRSLERLRAYYGSKGYFNNNTTYVIDTVKKKRGAIEYKIDLGQPFSIDSISRNIASKAIDSIYLLHTENAFVKRGDQFDLSFFAQERERLSAIFRNSGIYNFQESSISYDIAADTTKLADDQKMNIELNIENFKRRGDSAVTTSDYKVYKFNNVNIYTDYLYDERDSEQKFVRYDNYTIFYHNKLRFKPKTLVNAVFFEKDSIYREINRTRTYRQITNLGVFKYPTITSVPSSENGLDANIYLAARPKYSLGTSFEVTRSNIQQVGLALSPSLQARNLFSGAENLSIAGRVSIGSSNDPSIIDNRFFNIQEYGIDLNLDIPRLWFPFFDTSRIIPSYTLPKTRISLGTSFQKNIGLDKQAFNTVLSYNWIPSEFIKHNIELLNVQFVRNVNPDRFFNVYRNSFSQLNSIAATDVYSGNSSLSDFYESPVGNTPRLTIPSGTTGFTNAILNNEVPSTREDFESVSVIEERRQRLTENNLIFASNYTLNLNNREGLTDNKFFQFRFKFESAGNLLSAISQIIPFNKNENENFLVFGVPYSQYLKTEFDYVKYWSISRNNVLALRTFFGIAIPYGNSNNIPFVRSYFAGGANDIRAWSPYSLGPGRTDAINDFNEANLKISLNLEYRFPLLGNLKGALFADAGNIWNVFDNVEDPAATFTGFRSLEDIALGTGFGLRYDFTYFVLRADLGFKTYNPAEEISKRWLTDFNFTNAVLQIGINYPF
ncbi:translocation and assembly module lipoprotein TamL [Pareuzebyella sediminis]|uniref:translocation and assembly module lipoprotein TamL n=1 Tax=Pareuzebyella sediminis TaxID=2607998 RepID=UPI0011ED83EC|nr:BamA/TamA family outer membrane protein [Pareuzebyella sediminis]